ncbi:MAG: DUF4330 domain-containing protein [Eubacteriales bacterium]|nr:DUF4330 domain-containing protein [Eubacteriales bacterium]
MKILNEKGKLFGLINIVDLVIILIILAVVGGVGYKYLIKNETLFPGKKPEELKDYTVTVFCPMVPENTENYIKPGDVLFYDSHGELDAVIMSVRSDDISITPEGVELDEPHPYLKDLTVTIKISSDAADKRIMMAGIQINIGKEIYVKTYRVELLGYVTDIAE